MAAAASIDAQITDSVTQANVKVVGEAPAMAMGTLYQRTAEALAQAARTTAVSGGATATRVMADMSTPPMVGTGASGTVPSAS